MRAALELQGVSAGYGRGQVLWGVDLALPPGSVTALIGRNGVGKTTLLRTIMGVQRLEGGSIRLGGRDVGGLDAARRARAGIGYVPQGRHIFPQLTVAENLETGLAARAVRSGPSIADIHAVFPKLKDIAARKGGFLSGGEQQQLAIGRALLGAPSVLLLDEPSEGVQPNVVEAIGEALRQVAAEYRLTVLLVEQYLDWAWRLAGHYAVMDGGRVIRTGDTAAESAADVAHLVQV